MGIDCPPSIWEITVTLAACKFAGFITVDTIVNPPFVSQASLVSADCPPPTWEFTHDSCCMQICSSQQASSQRTPVSILPSLARLVSAKDVPRGYDCIGQY